MPFYDDPDVEVFNLFDESTGSYELPVLPNTPNT